ncbi:hypothetical protein ACN6MT_11280 [Neobacillus niacini]|uniref:hypothetical protein n=1 Tax=Neobacillus niacini TaxID=86668 RepID=UPI003B02B207
MPVINKDEQREFFNKAMKEIEADLEVLESLASDENKKDADRITRQIKHNLKAVWIFKNHE